MFINNKHNSQSWSGHFCVHKQTFLTTNYQIGPIRFIFTSAPFLDISKYKCPRQKINTYEVSQPSYHVTWQLRPDPRISHSRCQWKGKVPGVDGVRNFSISSVSAVPKMTSTTKMARARGFAPFDGAAHAFPMVSCISLSFGDLLEVFGLFPPNPNVVSDSYDARTW